jgi:FkbM family methyltransferase
LQLGNEDIARNQASKAMSWGCPPDLAARVLISGVHNTLGKAFALRSKQGKSKDHFGQAVVSNRRSEQYALAHSRTVKELASVGLLPQAAEMVNEEVNQAHRQESSLSATNAGRKVLETEIELLKHELSLAQQRGQLYAKREEVEREETAHLESLSVSQLGQDLWVLEKTNYKKGGFFVEFGATDGVLLSNTWLLEREFGWQGICAEPNPKFYEKLKRNRSCVVSDACIGANTGEEVGFIFADAYGGMKKHANSDMHKEKREAYSCQEDNVTVLETISLDDFLKQYDAPREIDYLSIDTEGSEYEILKAFPFPEWSIKCITVEHNYTQERENIAKLLESFGYVKREAEWDDWYIKTA